MIILFATLFIDLAAFALSQGSYERLPNNHHSAMDEAGFSGRSDEAVKRGDHEVQDDLRIISGLFSIICHHNENGIYYEEKGRLYAVLKGMPLLEDRGHIVGRPKNGYVVLIYDFEGNPVVAQAHNYKLQNYLAAEEVAKSYKPIPSDYTIVTAYVPHEPRFKVSDAVIQSGKRNLQSIVY